MIFICARRASSVMSLGKCLKFFDSAHAVTPRPRTRRAAPETAFFTRASDDGGIVPNARTTTSMRQISFDRSLAAALLLGAVLISFGLGAFPLLEPDEGRYADVARTLERGPDRLMLRLDGVSFHDKPPLVPWLGASSFAVLGKGELAARIVPAIFGIVGLAVAAWLASGARRGT